MMMFAFAGPPVGFPDRASRSGTAMATAETAPRREANAKVGFMLKVSASSGKRKARKKGVETDQGMHDLKACSAKDGQV
jgi:hypothetical protein